ncbi:hypothetical protein BDR03DRAFT_996731 [Suillus americanus]|nr:hypothetical protein BDR03DRAFT_996731 [Suillus americanus]
MSSKEISWTNSGRNKLRGLRFAEWAHSWNTPREEDLIQNFMLAQPSKELDDICAKIARWFSENIPGASSQVEKWLGGMPSVHAFTLVETQNKEWNDSELLKMACVDLIIISYPADSSGFVADVDLECLTTLEARMFEDSEEGPAGNQQWMLVIITGGGTCISTFLLSGFWAEITARVNLNDSSDATSADELSDVVAPSLPAEEETPVKRRPSLSAEECAPVKRQLASKREGGKDSSLM